MGPQHLSRWRLRLLVAGLFALVGLAAAFGPAAAQDDGEATLVTAWVRTCLEPGCTEDLSLTEPLDGIPVTIADAETGEAFGTCVTGDLEAGACLVDVRGAASVMVSVDESALPAGYVLDGNDATLDVEAGGAAEMPFLVFPEDGFPDEEAPEDAATPVDEGDDASDDGQVSALPETGTGTTSSGSGMDIGTVSIAALVTMMLGIAVFGGRAVMRQRP